jgi:hypothetical protein
MALTLKIGNSSGETNLMTVKAEYSMYTLPQLFKARYWFNSDGGSARGSRLEEEIQKRCAHIQRTISRKGSADTGAGSRFRPYGLIMGVVFLAGSIGPFVAVGLLDTINVIADVNGDHASLSGFWALLTLPFAIIVFLIGGMMDAERVVKWLDL